MAKTALLSVAVFCVCSAALATAQTISSQIHTAVVPPELAAPIRAAIGDGGVRVSVEGVTLDFWWVKGVPVVAPDSWSGVPEGTLVGAVRIGGDFRDIRGRIIRAGVYTLRFGMQPDDGDHLGASPFREFLLLSPAAIDAELAAKGHDATVDISKRAVGGSHPAVWSIDPPVASDAPLREHTTELGHRAVVVEVPMARDGKSAGTRRFGIVLIGKIEA